MNAEINPPLESRYSILPTAIGERLGGELAILNIETGLYFGLNGIGADIWERLGTTPTAREIVAHLTSEYEVEAERCAADVAALLARLLEARLIKAETGHA